MTAITASGGGAPTISTAYSYDAAGRRTSASNGADTLAFSYDSLNRPSAISRAGATISGATYNPDNTVASAIEPAGTASFTYDGLARLTSAAMPTLFAGSASFSWRPDGLLAGRAWPSGTTETFGYDAAKRPTTLSVMNGTAAVATLATSFNRVGNLTSESQTIVGISGQAGNSTISHTYDPLRRETGYTLSAPGSSPSTVAYTYDADSNRTSAGSTTFTFNPADQLTSETKSGQSPQTASYDAAGNLLSSPDPTAGLTTFTYTAENKPYMVAATGQPIVTYSYDALGRRASRTVGTTAETYSYVGTGSTIGRIPTNGPLREVTGRRIVER